MKKIDKEELSRRINLKYNNEWKIVGEYIDRLTPIEIEHQCEKCNYSTKYVTPQTMLQKSKEYISCEECNRIDKENTFINKLEEYNNTHDDEYDIGEDFIYINDKVKVHLIHYIDNDVHDWYVSPNNFICGNRCVICNMNVPITNEKLDNYLQVELNEEYIRLSDVGKNNKEKVLLRHNCELCKNNEFDVRPVDFMKTTGGTRCPICAMLQKESNGERELRSFIESLVECYDKEYSKTILNGKEIDILTKSNIGFEYNGEYWHQEVEDYCEGSRFKPIGYHKSKTIAAKEKDIKLYHIWEDQWKNNKNKVKEFIKKALNKL